MTRLEIRGIGWYLLQRWARKLEEQHALPAVLIGDGRDEAEGTLVVIAPENWSTAELLELLRATVDHLESQQSPRTH